MKQSKSQKSEYERFIEQPRRKKLFDKAYAELSISELVLSLMEKQAISVRALANEIGVSPTVIQGIRSSKSKNMKLSTLFGITAALGAKIKIEIGGRVFALRE